MSRSVVLLATVLTCLMSTTSQNRDLYIDQKEDLEGPSNNETTSPPSGHRQAFVGGTQNNMQAQVGLRTMMMGSMLYGLSLLPAMMMLFGGGGLGTLGGALASMGAFGKRSVDQHRDPTQIMEQVIERLANANFTCQKMYICQVYRKVATSGLTTDQIRLFKMALDKIVNGTFNKEKREINLYKAAMKGLDSKDCPKIYHKCGQQT